MSKKGLLPLFMKIKDYQDFNNPILSFGPSNNLVDISRDNTEEGLVKCSSLFNTQVNSHELEWARTGLIQWKLKW